MKNKRNELDRAKREEVRILIFNPFSGPLAGILPLQSFNRNASAEDEDSRASRLKHLSDYHTERMEVESQEKRDELINNFLWCLRCQVNKHASQAAINSLLLNNYSRD